MNLSVFEAVTNPFNLTGDVVFTVTFGVLLIAIALYAGAISPGNKNWWILACLSGVLVMASQFAMGNSLVHTLLLDGAAFAAIALVWIENTPEAKSAAKTYLALLVIAVICMAAGSTLGELGSAGMLAKVAAALLIVGYSLKLAFVPFYFWLPKVAEAARPMSTALIVSVIDIAAFEELVQLRAELPWVFTSYTAIWLTIALLSMIGGALLALSQQNIKRMLAFSTIDDMGYLLLGVTIGSATGISGALLAAISHAFFKVVLFGATGVAESKSGRELTLGTRGMATYFPVSSATFILGALGMIGVPPFLGFSGRWRLYLAGYEFGGPWLAGAMVAATALALLYYVRAIHKVWLGQPDGDEIPAGEPVLVKVVLILLVVIMLVAGLYPGWLAGVIG